MGPNFISAVSLLALLTSYVAAFPADSEDIKAPIELTDDDFEE
jgi:hypothetical protein